MTAGAGLGKLGGVDRTSSRLPQTGQEVLASGEQLVRVALVADVEEQPIVAEVEDVVERDREFDHAEVGGQVATAAGDLVANRGTDLVGDLRELFNRELAEVGG